MTNNIERTPRKPGGFQPNYGDWLTIVDSDDDTVRVVTDRRNGLGIRTYRGGDEGRGPENLVVRVEGADLDALKYVIDQLVAVRDGEATYDEPLYPEPYWTDGDTVSFGTGALYARIDGTWWFRNTPDGPFRKSVSTDEDFRDEAERRNAKVKRALAE